MSILPGCFLPNNFSKIAIHLSSNSPFLGARRLRSGIISSEISLECVGQGNPPLYISTFGRVEKFCPQVSQVFDANTVCRRAMYCLISLNRANLSCAHDLFAVGCARRKGQARDLSSILRGVLG